MTHSLDQVQCHNWKKFGQCCQSMQEKKKGYVIITRSQAIKLLIAAADLRIIQVEHIKSLLKHLLLLMTLIFNYRILQTLLLSYLLLIVLKPYNRSFMCFLPLDSLVMSLLAIHSLWILVHQITWLWCAKICPILSHIPVRLVFTQPMGIRWLFPRLVIVIFLYSLCIMFFVFLMYLIIVWLLVNLFITTILFCFPMMIVSYRS